MTILKSWEKVTTKSKLVEIKQYTASNKNSLLVLLRDVLLDYVKGNSLAIRIAKRDLKAQYRQSLFGFTWALIVPIASTILWVLLQKQGIIKISNLSIPYPVFVLSGILLWQLFVDALNSPINMFKQSKGMLNKINFPKESLILAGVYKIGFNFVLKFIVLIAVFAYYKVSPGSGAWLIPIGIFSILFLGTSIGVLITPIGALYNDVQQFLQTFMRLFFFLTPVIYVNDGAGFLGQINKYNPIGLLISYTRDWLTGSGMYGMKLFGIIFLISLVIFIVASLFYKISIPIIVERTGA